MSPVPIYIDTYIHTLLYYTLLYTYIHTHTHIHTYIHTYIHKCTCRGGDHDVPCTHVLRERAAHQHHHAVLGLREDLLGGYAVQFDGGDVCACADAPATDGDLCRMSYKKTVIE
jgi:hypothetical protein